MNGVFARALHEPRRFGLLLRLMLVGLSLIGASWSRDAHAYAWMIRQGQAKCGNCHVDPSGGELLTHMGRVMSETNMSTNWNDGKVSDKSKLAFGLDEPNDVRLGGSFRWMNIYDTGAEEDAFKTFPMQMDVYGAADFGWLQVGASLGAARISRAAAHSSAAQVTKVTFDAGDDADARKMAAISRWHWLGFELSDSMLLRVGRMNLPFGLRSSEHTLWAREATRTDRESDQQHGIALAQSTGPWRYEVMFSLGNFQLGPDDYRERGYVGQFEYLLSPHLGLGVSSSILTSGKSLVTGSQERTIRHNHGVTARWVPVDPATILLEADVIKNTGYTLGYTGFLTADYATPLQGLHIAATGEWKSTGKQEGGGSAALLGAGKPVTGLWVTGHWLFYTHLDLRVDFLKRYGADSQILAQIHMYL
jgi:hypothetical protein